jgi:ATP-binding cassette subfamily C (CFTR/MRP) protein 1
MNRACLVSAIYKKTLTMKAATVNKSDALTLMSSDVERVGLALRTIHEMWANLAQIGIAIFLVQQQLGVACTAPVALALCLSELLAKLYQYTDSV